MAAKDELGRLGERLAAEHLNARGFEILERNWRCRVGEIDIIARRGTEVAFVEVKTRSSLAYGHPFDAITPAKLARLRLLAHLWCAEQERSPLMIRIDAIAVVGARTPHPVIDHLERVS